MDTELLSDTFVDLADTMVADFDVIDFLHMLTDRSVQLLPASAAGVVLADPRGELRVAAASSEEAGLLELFQLQNDQGPCLECFRTGQPVTAADLTGPVQRWPRFARAATQSGFRAVQALPMRLRDQVIGALNLFARGRPVRPGGLAHRPGAGRCGHHRPAARAERAPPRNRRRAAPGRAEQPGRHRAGQGQARRAARHRHGPRLRDAARLRQEQQPASHRRRSRLRRRRHRSLRDCRRATTPPGTRRHEPMSWVQVPSLTPCSRRARRGLVAPGRFRSSGRFAF